MTKYGSDRPDLRYGMELHDLTDLKPQVADVNLFKADMIKCIAVPGGANVYSASGRTLRAVRPARSPTLKSPSTPSKAWRPLRW